MTSDHASPGSSSGTDSTAVPKETYAYRLNGLEYVEQKSWKDQSKKGFKCLVGDRYAIDAAWEPASTDSDAISRITLELGADKKVDGIQRHVCKIVIKDGYAWDWASRPTFDMYGSLWPSVIHDTSYQCMGLDYVTHASRKEVDRLFVHVLELVGMGWLRRRIWCRMVRLCLLGRMAAMSKLHKGRKYPGIAVLLLGVTGSDFRPVSKSQSQVAEWLDDLKGILGDGGGDLDAPCKGGLLHGGCLAVAVVLVRLGVEILKGETRSLEKVDS